ncbi:hypothetical protein [Halocalculus aciditolerans]|uniref:Uncharacterized protein n=1 Tax=Halocalculus aciditolerans TaxID=1383812 RepID=A0A830FKH2_9EURY|nr:hypothetical protein [Halocalculus aciditolerans]GGL55406.1 hypothetical protein GCM10009039_11930 [Halocalculus aciditolerans]
MSTTKQPEEAESTGDVPDWVRKDAGKIRELAESDIESAWVYERIVATYSLDEGDC